MFDIKTIKTTILCFEAKRWVGTMEERHNNGQIIKMFQRAVDDRADGEAWCMAFAQYCIKMAEKALLEIFPQHPSQLSSIFRSEHWVFPHIWTKLAM